MSTENPYPPPPAGPPNPGYPGQVPPAPQPGAQPFAPPPVGQPLVPPAAPQPGAQPFAPPPAAPQPGAQPFSPPPAASQAGTGQFVPPPSQPTWGSAPGAYSPPSVDPAGQPTAAFATGQYPPNGVPGAVAAPPKKKLLLPILIGALALLLIGGGVAFAGVTLGWFGGGGGKQPYEVMPGTTIAYLQMDLNPTADQKLAALSFFKELPELKDANANSVDVKKVIWNAIADANDTKGIEYEADLKPWVGDRIGIGALPKSDGDSVGVLAVQVTNEAAAKDKLPAVLTKSDSDLKLVTVKDGYAILTDSDTVDTVTTALKGDTLAKNATFSADLKALGNTGWSAGWFDIKATAESSNSSTSVDTANLKGRATYALRFSGNTLELTGSVIGADPKAVPASNGGTDLGDLPAETGMAASVQGGADWVNANWDLIESAMGSSYYTKNLTQEDLTAALGKQATVAMSNSTLKSYADSSYANSLPEIGFKVNTSNPTRLKAMVQGSYSSSTMKIAQNGDTVSMAYTDAYLAKLSVNTGDKLSGSAKFNAVVPDYSKASIAAYLDLSSLSGAWSKTSSVDSDYVDFLKALSAVGLSVRPTNDGATWSLRVSRS
jgi:hypothetical protein